MKEFMSENLARELAEAEAKAWDALARYKFWMFGYWCGVWVHLNRIGGFGLPNPWKELVLIAREKRKNKDIEAERDQLSLFGDDKAEKYEGTYGI